MSTTPLAAVILESLPVFLLRGGLFYASRNYILRSLYHDLKDLSTDVETYNPVSTDDDVELDSLPVSSPSSASSTKAHQAQRRTFHSVLSRTLFSFSFSESCTLFILLMLQGLDILHARTRLLNWNLSLSVLLLSIVVLIPLSYSLVLSYRSSSLSQTLQRPTPLRLFFTTLPVGLFLFSLSFVPLPQQVSSTSALLKVLSRLIVVGTVFLGLLPGFGAVNNAWIFFPHWGGSVKNKPTDEDILVAERGLQRVRDDLTERRGAIARLEASQPKPSSGWLSNVMPSFSGSSQLSSATQELNGLLALEYQMSRNLEALRQQQAETKFSQTIQGKLFNFGGRLFALYCVYRIVVSTINLVLPVHSTSSPGQGAEGSARLDYLTMALAYLVSFIPWLHWEKDEIAVIARQISLGLVGLIILSSIRLVLRGVNRVLRVTSRNLGASLMLLILAQLMGIYLLSALIQLRTSFPPPPSRPDTEPDDGTINLFSTLPEYQVFGSLFDGSFLLAAAASAVILWFDERINGAGTVS